MRPTIATRLLAPTVFCAAMIALPAAAHATTPPRPAPVVAPADGFIANGLYSLTVRGTDAQQRIDLMLTKDGDKYTGRLITFDQEVALENVEVDGNTIKARVVTNFGRATVTLKIGDADVKGTLDVAKKHLAVTGERVY